MKTRKHKMKLGNAAAVAEQAKIEQASFDAGLWLNVRQMAKGGRPTFHWFWTLDRDSVQVMHYWPGNGKWWCPETNEKGTFKDAWEALEKAERLSHEV